MSHDHEPPRYGHARLTSTEPDGRLVREVVPVRLLGDDEVEVLGSPAYVVGCAAGDVVRLQDDAFEVVRRGPNVCVQAFGEPFFDPEFITRAEAAFQALDGYVEVPHHRQFFVATVPATAGRTTLIQIMNGLAAAEPKLILWQFGNE